MNDSLDAAKLKAQQTYNAASDTWETALPLWDGFCSRTVEQLRLHPGSRVLDVCCGTGASALPAARAVGAEGAVLAIDLADQLLNLGRAKAESAGLDCIQFRQADMTSLGLPSDSHDAVICVFGIFFVPDMKAQVRELWRMVRPGGQLAITTWGPRLFAPGYEVFWEAVRNVRPDLHTSFHPWDRITRPEEVHELFHDAGVSSVEVATEERQWPLRAPEDFWTIAMGTGMRWTIDQMGADLAQRVKGQVLSELAAGGVKQIETNVVYAIARKALPEP